MGLDTVELVMATEEAFGLDIPDRIAERMRTPRDVVAFLHDQLPQSTDTGCLTQHAFYRLRATCARHLAVDRRDLAPALALTDLLAADDRLTRWDAIGADLGVRRWPRPRSPTWWGQHFQGRRPVTLGDAARYAATWYPRAMKGPDAGWSRTEVERAFIALLQAETGVNMRQHTLDSTFVGDMGLD